MLSKRNTLFFTLLLAVPIVCAQPWYVSATGSDSGSGTATDPFRTIEKAVTAVQPGQTIFIKGGTYNLVTPVSISKNGTESAPISIFASPGERPVLNFSGQPLDGSNRGIRLTGSYWQIKGIDITCAGDNGMKIEGGSHNIIENCAFYRNRDSGLQIDGGASYNTVKNCDSYFNADPPDYGDADGFAPKLTAGSGNYFYGCRAWKNSDDGWDGYLRGADDISTSAENCWAFENGYLEDGTDAGVNANGNGFKMGGSDDKTLNHNFTLKNCLAFGNKAKGFDQNNNPGSMTLYNCTGYNNLTSNYRITQALAAGKTLTVKNCADLGNKAEIGSFAQQEKNSWLSPFMATAADFRSIDAAAARGPRKADGSLPDIEFMHLMPGSDLIDAGVNVGLTFAGPAPDLGCFETGLTAIRNPGAATAVLCFPNPINDQGIIQFTLTRGGKCEIGLYDISGRFIRNLTDRNAEAGEQSIVISVSDIRDGIYICRGRLNGHHLFTFKLAKTDRIK